MVIVPLLSNATHVVFGILMFLVATFLILLVLVQRGRGGDLSGAFGGMGGQSAFGARAGDTFTYITIWTAAVWIVLCIAGVKLLSVPSGKLGAEEAVAPITTQPAGGTSAAAPGAELDQETGIGTLDNSQLAPATDDTQSAPQGEAGGAAASPSENAADDDS